MGTVTGENAAKARGMLKAIKAETFLYFLHDVTKILRELSLQFQSDLLITEVSTKLERALTKLEVLKDSDPLPITATFQANVQSNYNPENVEKTVILKFYCTREMRWGYNKHFLTF